MVVSATRRQPRLSVSFSIPFSIFVSIYYLNPHPITCATPIPFPRTLEIIAHANVFSHGIWLLTYLPGVSAVL